MIPNYRIRIYCLILAPLFLLGAWAGAQEIYGALITFEFDALTGPRLHRIKEHFVFDEQPWRFSFYFLRNVMVLIIGTWVGLFLAWGVLRGRKAFKRWSR